MEKLQLNVVLREKGVKAKRLLEEKKLPIEYYGNGIENISFQVVMGDFRRVFKKTGFNTVLNLAFEGKNLPVLVHEVAIHPVTDEFIHVDFKAIKMDEEVETTIPLEFVGTSVAVKDFSGTFVNNLDEVEVKCLPGALVQNIEVDISALVDFNSQITIKDLIVPKGIKIMHEEDESVCSVLPPKVEEEAPVATEAAEGAAPAEGASAVEEKKE